jgi:hypothetical protein
VSIAFFILNQPVMNKKMEGPGPKDRKRGPETGTQPDTTPRREGGEDSLAESAPTDDRSDEKVIVNEQRENKIVNSPSQTAINPGEGSSYDEET